MVDNNTLKTRVLDVVANSTNQRARPNDVKQTLAKDLHSSPTLVNAVIRELVEEGDLVYSYRDPCSYVEIPCNGCDGGYRAARPMHVVTDSGGNRWLCDSEAELTNDLPNQCWECGDMAFTRAS